RAASAPTATEADGATAGGLDPAPVPGFVLSDIAPATGDAVTVRNVSRAGGTPIGATFEAGDGRAPVSLGPDGSLTVVYTAPGSPTPTLRAGPAPGTAAVTTIEVDGAALPPVLTYTGPTTAAVGAEVEVTAE